jgi:orotidine-5'-phosphate decarboxylase
VSASPTGPVAPARFADRVAHAVDQRESQLVLGLDPDPATLWPASLEAGRAAEAGAEGQTAAVATAAAFAAQCRALIDAAGDACVAVKLQLACFERLGAAGWEALAVAARHARAAGLLVIADGKRGDVPVTAAAYADALLGATATPFGEVAGLGADATTLNPLLGVDSLEPVLEAADRGGRGVFLLVRTSNPGAADVEDLELAGGIALWERLAEHVARLGAGRVGECSLSDVGAVVGATAPRHLERMRELMPAAIFLLPGVGAQGGNVEDLAPAFAPGRAGGLVTVSRGIARAHEQSGGDPARAAGAEARRLRALAWDLAGG